jgi:parallel beta-helix repeat protein
VYRLGIKNLVFLTSLVFLLLSIGTVEADTCGGVTACHCGDTLTSSHTMTYDLINCAGHGIVIGANGIILDCQGHTIDGDGTVNMKYGIYSDGKNNNIIKNCVATDFSNSSSCGIYLSSSNNNVLINNTANSNYYGIVLYYSSNSTLTNNTANSKHYGIYLSA